MQTEEFVDLFNEAQRVLHGIVYANAPSVYVTTGTIDLVADQEAYTLPTDSFLDVNVISVEYKYGDGDNDYRKLRKRSIHERSSSQTGTPQYYIMNENQIWINPRPSEAKTSGIRVTYERQLRSLDVRRGKISSFGGTSTAPTSIVLDSTTTTHADVGFAGDVIGDFITVVDKDGAVQMKDIPITAWDSSTKTLTIGSFTAAAGEAIAAADWVVIGTNASTHSEFPDFCEMFLTEYVRHAILETRGSEREAEIARTRLTQLGEQIADVYADANADITYIPEIDPLRPLDL